MNPSLADFKAHLIKSGCQDIPDDSHLEEILYQAELNKAESLRPLADKLASFSSAKEMIRADDAEQKVRLARLETMLQSQGEEIASLRSHLQVAEKRAEVLEEIAMRLKNLPAPSVRVDLDSMLSSLNALAEKISEQKAPVVNVDLKDIVNMLAELLSREFNFSPTFRPNINVFPAEVKTPISIEPAPVVHAKRSITGWEIQRDRYGAIAAIVPKEDKQS